MGRIEEVDKYIDDASSVDSDLLEASFQPLKEQSGQGRVTFKLLFLVLSLSFGGWFGLGYTFIGTNAPQNVITSWIQQVQCNRLQNAQSNGQNVSLLPWCIHVPVEEEFNLLHAIPELNTIWAVVGCSFAVGAFFAVLFTNLLVAKFGNKNALMITNVIALIGTILSGVCVVLDSYEVFIASRILLGCQGAFVIAIIPMFISEVAPAHLRGALGTIPGLSMQLGGLTAVLLGLPQTLGTVELWPYIFWLRLVPVIVLFVALPFCPESPRYLQLVRRDKDGARKALQWLRGREDVSYELKAIQAESQSDGEHRVLGILDLFRNPFLRKVTFIIIVVLVANQFSCIAGIALYSTSILLNAGLGNQEALLGTIGLMVIQVIAVVLSMFLLDRAGRKVLFLGSSYGCIICLSSLMTFMALASYNLCESCRYGSVTALVCFMLVFNVGAAFIPWVLVSEMFDQSARGAAMMVASLVCHGGSLIVALTFPILQQLIDFWSFGIFAGIMLLASVYLQFKLIETKGKDIARIQVELRHKLM